MKKTIRINKKVIGHVINNVFVTNRQEKKHLFIKYNAYGLSQAVLEELNNKGVEHILILTDNLDYKFTLEEYLNSKLIHYDGQDKQKFVSISSQKDAEDEKNHTTLDKF